MEYFGITDIGLVREKNQDSYLCKENKYGDVLFLVADGIGGGKAGEVASSQLIRYFDSIFESSGEFETVDNIISFLKYHLDQANKKILEMSVSNSDYYGMGTTLTGILISKVGNVVINCGDSRVYGFNNNEICQLTFDHTLVNEMLLKKQITPEQAINHPKRHYLVKAVGIYDNIKADYTSVSKYDYYLVCSDGLHSYVNDDELYKIIFDDNKSCEQKAIDLKDLALLKGGYDNITAILVRM